MASNTESSGPFDLTVAIVVGVVIVATMVVTALVNLTKWLYKKHTEKKGAQAVEAQASKGSVQSGNPEEAPKSEAAAVVSDRPLLPLVLHERTNVDASLPGVADQHLQLRFNESFSASVSFYRAENLVRGKLRAISPAAAQVMREAYGSDRFDLPCITLAGSPVEDVIESFTRSGIALIRTLLKQPNTDQVPTANEGATTAKAIPEEAVAQALKILMREMHGTPKAETNNDGVQTAHAVSGPAMATEVKDLQVKRSTHSTYTGVVLGHGNRKSSFGSGSPAFELTLQQSNGEDITLSGVRLRELVAENEVHLGDRVEVKSLGKIQLPNNIKRNEYELRVLERANTYA